MAESQLIEVRLSEIRHVARDINLYRLRAIGSTDLRSGTAGGHIDVHLSNGLIRQYSLVINSRSEKDYVIAVKEDAASRGGSTFIHKSFQVGMTLTISGPRNHFPLNEAAPHTVLIAGGIGITPIYSMVQRLVALEKAWVLYYASRSRADMAFIGELLNMPNVHCHFDDESQGAFLNIRTIIHTAPNGSHFYCCGPMPLMQAFETEAIAIPTERKHVEYFGAKDTPSLQGGFSVTLARSGKTLFVPPGRSILEVIIEAGVAIEHSCTEGICGTCETKVLSGIPDHRDSVLSPSGQAANDTMMICCSGSKTPALVLDL